MNIPASTTPPPPPAKPLTRLPQAGTNPLPAAGPNSPGRHGAPPSPSRPHNGPFQERCTLSQLRCSPPSRTFLKHTHTPPPHTHTQTPTHLRVYFSPR
jgi:hypothetical protein